MWRAAVQLRWQGLADRAITARLRVRVDSLKKVSAWRLGARRSPSVAGWLPDVHALRATVLDGPADLIGRRLRLDIPGPEAARLAVDGTASLALVSLDDQGGIVVAAAPSA